MEELKKKQKFQQKTEYLQVLKCLLSVKTKEIAVTSEDKFKKQLNSIFEKCTTQFNRLKKSKLDLFANTVGDKIKEVETQYDQIIKKVDDDVNSGKLTEEEGRIKIKETEASFKDSVKSIKQMIDGKVDVQHELKEKFIQKLFDEMKIQLGLGGNKFDQLEKISAQIKEIVAKFVRDTERYKNGINQFESVSQNLYSFKIQKTREKLRLLKGYGKETVNNSRKYSVLEKEEIYKEIMEKNQEQKKYLHVKIKQYQNEFQRRDKNKNAKDQKGWKKQKLKLLQV